MSLDFTLLLLWILFAGCFCGDWQGRSKPFPDPSRVQLVEPCECEGTLEVLGLLHMILLAGQVAFIYLFT